MCIRDSSLDAHGDNLKEHLGALWSGACWVARTFELEHVNPAKHVQLGMRGPRNFKDQVGWFREAGARLITMGEVRMKGIEAITAESLAIVRRDAEKLVLTVDYDVMDLGCAPGLDEPYGLYVPELLHLMYEVGKAGVDSMAVGWIPAAEPGQFAIVILSLLYMLAGMIEGRELR